MKAEKPTQENIDRLKAWIEANEYTVYTVLRHISKSGMMREISVVIPIIAQDGTIARGFVHPSYTIAGLLGWSYSDKNGHNAVVVTGCGMDMGFNMVYVLSEKLYGDGRKIQQEWI